MNAKDIAVIKKMLAENAWAPGTKLPSEIELDAILASVAQRCAKP